MLHSLKFKQNEHIPVRRETHEGREHLVVPVVMMVEGVHCGSGGPMFYPLDVIAQNVQTWNGMPVPVFHPNDNGMPVSCNSPEMIEQMNVGRLYNAHIEGDKLKAEAWIDVSKAQKIDPQLIPAIQSGFKIDVSTGLYSDDIMTPGEWNGETYDGIIRDIRPDHLALLPGQEGACNWQDGCGIRANKEGGELLKIKNDDEAKTIGQALANGESGVKAKLKALARFFGFQVNDISNDDLRQKLQLEIDKLDVPPEPAEGLFHYVREIYGNDGYFIYEARKGAESKLFKQAFELNDAGEIKMKGKAKEVLEETNYIAAAKPKTQEVVKTMERKERIDALIANERCTMTENDRDWLAGLDDCSFDKVEKIHSDLDAKWKEAEARFNAKPDPEPKDQSMDEYIANAPPEIGDVLKESVEMRANRKADLVKGILANKTNAFTENELKAKGVPELEKLAKMASVDFSGRGGVIRQEETKLNERQTDGTGVPDMPVMNFGK